MYLYEFRKKMYQLFETTTVAISTGTYLFTNLLKWAYNILQEKL